MDDQLRREVAKIGGLIEHAAACQKAATDAQAAVDAGLARLNATADLAAKSIRDATNSLDTRIKSTIDTTVALAVKAQLQNIPLETRQQVAESLKTPIGALTTAADDAAKASGKLGARWALIAASMGVGAILAAVAAWWVMVPHDLAQQRADSAALDQLVRRCDGQLCVRVGVGRSYTFRDVRGEWFPIYTGR